MELVLDASVALAGALKEVHPAVPIAFAHARAGETVVPVLWWFELRNGLVVNERRGRLTRSQSVRFLRDVARLPIAVDWPPDERSVMELARLHKLTVYDAAYLELALRSRIGLATLDVALARAAIAEGVAVIGQFN